MISIHEMYLYFENLTTGRKSLGNRKIQVKAYIASIVEHEESIGQC